MNFNLCPVCGEEFIIQQIDTKYIIAHRGFMVRVDEIEDGIDSMKSIINTYAMLGRFHT